MTKYSELILNIINEATKHLTAEDIFLALKENEPKIVLASVYNNLNALCNKRLIKKISVTGRPDYFDKIKKHDHVICQKCGEIYDFNFDDLTYMLESKLGDKIVDYDLKVNYICKRCEKLKKS